MIELTQQGPAPTPGAIVHVRTRTWLAEAVNPGPLGSGGTVVHLACLDDDAQGQLLDVVWELELDAAVLGPESWKRIGSKGFDPPRHFAAYYRTLRWNAVTATDPRLFQSPFRAGIRLDAYQLEPLRKALQLPRVNLFIADDVGLGKTIEAGLIASELLLRRRVRDIVVVCPPTMVPQWRDEMESRFGLAFEVMDRGYVDRMRQERGWAVNPWTTFPRFLVSSRLLIDETYTTPLRAWLDNLRPGSLLIFDEAHHAAPASGAKYAIDSQITKAMRDLAERFEHRLFLSATPHNGHSNSFSALLEILDRNRFLRGTKVVKSNLEAVMVRRLKEDVRELVGGFPKRRVVQVDLPAHLGETALPESDPELRLAALLDEYAELRKARLAGASKRKQAEAGLLVSGLQQRLLSSVEAFARTLKVHRATMERIWAADEAARASEPTPAPQPPSPPPPQPTLAFDPARVAGTTDPDDDASTLPEDEQAALHEAAIEAATNATAPAATSPPDRLARERSLLAEMATLAEDGRGRPDARIRYLVQWISKHLCAAARVPGTPAAPPSPERAAWRDTRLLIFTEYDDTKRYLQRMLAAAIAGTDRAADRIAVFHGPTPPEEREAIKRAFNAPPADSPLRILIATDAAREGLNLQAHCHNLFHFDVPWNPSRLEQRNGRIDRKLQPRPEVFCHYFVYTQRPEDRVLETLVKKTERIRKELGSLSEVLEARLHDSLLKTGIRRADVERQRREIDDAGLDPEHRQTVEDELEATRDRQQDVGRQIETLRTALERSKRAITFEPHQLRDALDSALELLDAPPLAAISPAATPVGDATTSAPRFALPDLAHRAGADATWAATLDSLRELPRNGRRDFAWRRDAPIRPVVFDAPTTLDDSVVQLHLSHRVVQRLLGRFLAQGFVYHDLSRACLAQADDAIPRVALLGRLSLYGPGAVRLHEEILSVTARWLEPAARRGPLAPYGREAEARTLELLERSLAPGTVPVAEVVARRLLASLPQDLDDLLPHLDTRGAAARADAEAELAERASKEAAEMRRLLESQRDRVVRTLDDDRRQLVLPNLDEVGRRQRDAERKAWQRFLDNVDGDLAREPARIESFYRIATTRIEPVGLVYLWPVSG